MTRAAVRERLVTRLGRPPGLVPQTRWLFWLCAAASLILTVPLIATVPDTASRLLGLLGAALLLASWTRRYLRGTASLARDLLEALAVTALAVGSSQPATAIGIVFSSLWFRAIYGTTRRVALQTVLGATAIVLAVPLWPLVPAHVGAVPFGPLLGALPMLFVTAAIARYLALSLIAREQAQRRDAALATLGSQLLTVSAPGEIGDRSWEAVEAIAAATPGLRIVLAYGDAGSSDLQVHRYIGTFTSGPVTVPRLSLPDEAASGEMFPLVEDATLAALAGFEGTWLYTRLPIGLDGFGILGAPAHVPADAIVTFQSMLSQISLAVRNDDARHDLTVAANTDGLTGLANRAAFTAALESGLRDRPVGVAVLFVDLDDFKDVNDGFGHAAGDALLSQVAARLEGAVRPGDLCARLGGDEFGVLLRDAADDITDGVARRLVEVLAQPFGLRERVVHVGASIGVAHAFAGGTAEQIVQRADVAMYAAKARGKNRHQVFDLSLQRVGEQQLFEAELAAAAAAGELVVHYQPVISLATDRCAAVEALVRWQHPVRGLLGPAEFIETAERTSAIVGIGTFVLRRACADGARWSESVGVPLSLHVNVSVAQLTDPAFVEIVAGLIEEFGLAPKQLVLEITETMVLDSAPIRATLDALVGIGAALAIDDFGTGYSALTTLRTLPLDIVKIDRSFVAGCPSNTADEAVVEAIVQMARRLGLATVAEGVERPEQQRFLRRVGADAVQGFLHLRPVPAADFELWLAGREVRPAVEASNIVLLPRRAG